MLLLFIYCITEVKGNSSFNFRGIQLWTEGVEKWHFWPAGGATWKVRESPIIKLFWINLLQMKNACPEFHGNASKGC